MSNYAVRMREWAFAPKIHAFVDLGSQAEDWVVDDLSRYYLFGLSLDVPVFHGGRNSRALDRSRLDLDLSRNRLQLMNRQLELSENASRDNLSAAIQQMQSARTQLSSAEAYFRLIDNGYRQGVNTFIEFLDARSQLTSSRLSLNVRILEVLSAHASLERETASFTLPQTALK
ncbi:MAG: TolC family protein, partial [Bacteroidota bacterium]